MGKKLLQRQRWSARPTQKRTKLDPAQRCRRKFLRYFPDGFRDETYIDWERGYKWTAHERWVTELNSDAFDALLSAGAFEEVARRALAIESRTNLLFSFEKMALRDAVRTPAGAKAFALGLFDFLYRSRADERAFQSWCEVVASLPRRQTRVLTWPVVTVFGFIALPEKHFFLKPVVTKTAAEKYGYSFEYTSKPNWRTYSSALDFAEMVGRDVADLEPRDMIDLQSFIWVMGSDEYP